MSEWPQKFASRVEVVQGLFVLVPLPVDDLERLGHDEAPSLLDASGEVQVYLHVPVYVVEPLAVGAVHVDGHLPGVAPVLDVLPCKRVGALQLDDHLLHALAVALLGQVEVTVRRVQHVPCLLREQSAEKIPYIHGVTSCALTAVVNCK